MAVAVYSGSFNPFTIGHLDILLRGLALFDRVIIVAGVNTAKAATGNSAEILQCKPVAELVATNRVEVIEWSGLTVEAARAHDAAFLLRGARSATDFDYERNMADINRILAPDIDTVILPARPELAMISSSMVRELKAFGADTSHFTP